MRNYDVEPKPGFEPQLAILAATLGDSTREWRRNLGRVSPEAMTWQCYPDGPSVGGLLMHLIESEAYWIREFADGDRLAETHPAVVYNRDLNVSKPFWPAPPGKPFSWYRRLHDEVRAEMMERISKASDPTRSYGGKRYSLTYRWILAHIVGHDSYTGGQAVLVHEMYKKIRKT